MTRHWENEEEDYVVNGVVNAGGCLISLVMGVIIWAVVVWFLAA